MIKIILKLIFIFAFFFISCKSDLDKRKTLDSCCDFITPPPPPFNGTILVDENYIIDKSEVQIRIIAERLTNNLDKEQQNYILTTKKGNRLDTFCFLLPFECALHWKDIKTEYNSEEKVIYIGFIDENSMYRLYKLFYGTGINRNSIKFLSLIETKLPLDIESRIKTENKFKKYSESRRNGTKISPKIWRKGILKVQRKYYEEICIGEIQNLSQKIEYRKYYNKESNSLNDKLW